VCPAIERAVGEAGREEATTADAEMTLDRPDIVVRFVTVTRGVNGVHIRNASARGTC
jgi:hypothetical protein